MKENNKKEEILLVLKAIKSNGWAPEKDGSFGDADLTELEAGILRKIYAVAKKHAAIGDMVEDATINGNIQIYASALSLFTNDPKKDILTDDEYDELLEASETLIDGVLELGYATTIKFIHLIEKADIGQRGNITFYFKPEVWAALTRLVKEQEY